MTTMHTAVSTTALEHMLESADHLIEKHRVDQSSNDWTPKSTPLPEGWVLYSTRYEVRGAKQGWHIEIMNTMKPFRNDSIVDVWHKTSLDAALTEARGRAALG